MYYEDRPYGAVELPEAIAALYEQRYEQFVAHPTLQAVLARYYFHYHDFLDLHPFTLLEQPLLNLAADRIDYTLRAAWLIPARCTSKA